MDLTTATNELHKAFTAVLTLVSMHRDQALVTKASQRNMIRRIHLLNDITDGLPLSLIEIYIKKQLRERRVPAPSEQEVSELYHTQLEFGTKLNKALRLAA